ncbi:MAG TPA: hypothetical protein VF665_17765 [Longimicrobium sp.]|uniref:hypothetical protein n=1 Tax=Longimicrobium sp. TaxID=2029185 RepID=UPI002EDBA9AB
MNGQLFDGGYPSAAEYADGTAWFINNEVVPVLGRRFVKYGMPRILGINDVVPAATYQGVRVFVEAGPTGAPEVVYLPVRSGCEFQPYQLVEYGSAVRGQ